MSQQGYSLVDHLGRPIRSARKARRAAAPGRSFDSAYTAEENREHWSAADSLSARSANSADVRQRLRDRSRYEAANNPYLRAVISSLANDTVGTGPRLQLAFPEFTDPDFRVTQEPPANLAHEVELRWQEWCDLVGLTDKLILIDKAETRDGEVFALKRLNTELDSPVKLDMHLIEADVCTTPDINWADPYAVDGMRLDAFGNVVEYHFLKRHPGDMNWWTAAWDDYDRVPARNVCHVFNPDRVAEYRGLPETTASLGTYADARGYRKSVLHAARTHASITAVIESKDGAYTQTIPDEHGEDDDAFDKIPLNRDTYMEMPDGKTVKFLSPTQPIPSYPETSGEFNSESGRAINNAPRNIATGSSREYNFSSGKLDRQGWNRGIEIRRDRRRRTVLLPFFRSWYEEARLIPGYLPSGLPPVNTWIITWYWDGFESIDPLKDAAAAKTLREANLLTLEEWYASKNKDWKERIRQMGRERREMEKEGVSDPLLASATPAAVPVEEEEVE